jgi:ppGpp synthetase/RelA/SpoT-type nucleotidyltranferase
MIMEEYRESRADFKQLGDVVNDVLKTLIKENHIKILEVTHRVKAEDSLAGKLELKGDKYASLSDITDILGVRVICYFSDDIDSVASIVEKEFEVDWDNSVDKRAQLSPDAFGYLSLHYICSLTDTSKYPENICGKKFEIQIRTVLQHTWAAIEHDLGYKTDFGIPRQIVRDFSRLAGLLELADKEFMSIRDNITAYSDNIRNRIANNEANDITIDLVSLREYVLHNHAMRDFLGKIAGVCNAEISDISPEVYLDQLHFLGKRTIGDLQDMLAENGEYALKLAKYSLGNTDLDILSSNVGLRYLCHAELVLKGYEQEKVQEFIAISVGNAERARKQTKRLLDIAGKIGVPKK